jgi:2-haloacid dehalogenase
MIKAVVFDYGNVVVRWDPNALFSRFFPDATERAGFMADIDFPAWHQRHDEGLSFAENRVALIARFPHYRDALEAFETHFGETLAGEISETRDVIDALEAKGMPMFVLTNMPASQKETCLAASTRRHLFRDVICSGEELVAKPEPAIWTLTRARIERRLDVMVAPEEVAFIDDAPKNVDAARSAGWQAILFEAPYRLAGDLRALGAL